MVRKRRRGVFNFWASICYEMFPIRHLMERVRGRLSQTIEALMKVRLLKLEGRGFAEFLRLILVKLSRESSSRIQTLWKERVEHRGKEKKRTRAKETMDFYARVREWNRSARDSYGRLFSKRSNRQWEARRFLKRIWLFSSASRITLSCREFLD